MCEAASSPTRTVASPGTTPRSRRRPTRRRTSSRTAAATALPSIVCPTECPSWSALFSIEPSAPQASVRRAVPLCYTCGVIVGVPRETKDDENRVALTPSGANAIRTHGHTVLVEHGAGIGSRLPDALYRDAGATLADAEAVWARADLLVKVKEPLPAEYPLLRPDAILFTYLHLAANPTLAHVLIERRVRALAYETLQLEDGSLPLLAPMSEVAGRLSVQVGAFCLQA